MRPVVKPELPASLFPADAGALLLQTLGEYCSVSEQPLPAEHYVWDKRAGAQVVGRVSQQEWLETLLLSEVCFLASRDRRRPNLLLPDDPKTPTFSLREKSPFLYEMRTIRLIVVAEEGNVLGEQDCDRVVVVGTTEDAQATIDYFGLNTVWYDRDRHAVVIPEVNLEAGEARLLWQRTEVYLAAQRLVDSVAESRERDQAAVVEQGRRSMAAAGYWSTWATVFMQRGMPVSLLELLLLPPQPGRWRLGPGGHRPFPGTNGAVV
jgi:hypothetical protein